MEIQKVLDEPILRKRQFANYAKQSLQTILTNSGEIGLLIEHHEQEGKLNQSLGIFSDGQDFYSGDIDLITINFSASCIDCLKWFAEYDYINILTQENKRNEFLNGNAIPTILGTRVNIDLQEYSKLKNKLNNIKIPIIRNYSFKGQIYPQEFSLKFGDPWSHNIYNWRNMFQDLPSELEAFIPIVELLKKDMVRLHSLMSTHAIYDWGGHFGKIGYSVPIEIK